jgi:hypothetical protein
MIWLTEAARLILTIAAIALTVIALAGAYIMILS